MRLARPSLALLHVVRIAAGGSQNDAVVVQPADSNHKVASRIRLNWS